MGNIHLFNLIFLEIVLNILILVEVNFYVKLKVKKTDGSEFDTEKKESAVFIDMILHSMWSSVDIKMNHTLVSTSGTELHVQSTF